MSFFSRLMSKGTMVSPEDALTGRPDPIPTSRFSLVNGNPIKGPYPEGFEIAEVAMGCYWGAERAFWDLPGVWVTAVGFEGGITPNPTYRESTTELTGHAETVRVVFDPALSSYEDVLKRFWESHDPTQGMRQGNDTGTAYRSAIYARTDEQLAAALASRDRYAEALEAAGKGPITTEVEKAGEFYFAEAEHQQYLHRIPDGYCSMSGTGVSCPIGSGVSAA